MSDKKPVITDTPSPEGYGKFLQPAARRVIGM